MIWLEKFWLAVTYFQFPIQVCFSATVSHSSICWALICLLWPWTLTYDLQLRTWPYHAKYLYQRSHILSKQTDYPTYCSIWTTTVISKKQKEVAVIRSFSVFITSATLASCISCRHVSVCPSQVGVLLKWLNTGSHKQCHTISQGLYSFLMLKISAKFEPGHPQWRCQMQLG